MAVFKTFSQIVRSMIDRLKLTQVNLDIKPGSVSRDLFIDPQADEISKLYKIASVISDKQSPEKSSGEDLKRWAKNFGISKRSSTPSNGLVVFTTNSINNDISIPEGTIVTARNGSTFTTIGNYVLSSEDKNRLAGNAVRLRDALNEAGISDQYALEVPVTATNPGTSGNISPLQIISSNIQESVKVTNLTSFRLGNNEETDSEFKAKIFAKFSGSNSGNSSSYRASILSLDNVIDVLVVEPGNSLMLRDGTETIELSSGTYRILSSGTGGKVDIYIMGTSLEEVTESYIYTDLSGNGNPEDERNDFIPGKASQDLSRTSMERRILALSTGNMPLQPVNSIISIIGSQSGLLTEKVIDSDGNISGNYELIKDLNPDTGGSPFSFDKIRFISGEKEVSGESISKKNNNSVDPLRFTDVQEISEVYQDIQITNENSEVSAVNRTTIILNHTPITNVSSIVNSTTGESYVVEDQNLNDSGLNWSGEVTISGRTLPSSADILDCNYTWRVYFDPFFDYNGYKDSDYIIDDSISDSVDWGVSNGISEEESFIELTEDEYENIIYTDNKISRVISVYTKTEAVGALSSSDGKNIVTLDNSYEVISNVISVKDENNVEVFNTISDSGTFSGRVIYLPEDSKPLGTSMTVSYNKIELFDINYGNGFFTENIITLPSEDILSSNNILSTVNSLYSSEEPIYVKYIADTKNLISSTSLSSLPVNSSESANLLFDSSFTSINGSLHPVSFYYDDSDNIEGIYKFSPSRLNVSLSGTVRDGKIKVTGETIERINLTILGINISGKTVDITSALKSYFDISSIPYNYFIGKVDYFYSKDNDQHFDTRGISIQNNKYSKGYSSQDSSLNKLQFRLPDTSNNDYSKSSGEQFIASIILVKSNDFEELYFPFDSSVKTDKMFARINRVTVSSGFRSSSGVLVGNILIESFNQPNNNESYNVDYKFTCPKEGERLTVNYNINKLIIDSTLAIEDVRPTTADVLVKESFELKLDVSGEIIVNSNFEKNSETIKENCINAIVNLLNSPGMSGEIDYSDIITVGASVSGIDSINISLFNESGSTGRRTSIKALDNQYLTAGNVSLTVVSRKDFKIT